MPFSRLILPVVLALSGTVAAIAAQPAATPTVHISNFTFGPQVLKIRAGETVIWVNDDDIPHTVAAADRSFKSKVLDTGDRFSFTFTHAGSVSYFCSLHPHMTGTVLVTAK
ncbi:MAG: amicyanin [Sphingomonas bacterium]|uniref:cupredoxin domain-containing protein n=1 Tax=Sphingomonas bacterium TaxID=1895847 RepID=UPI00262E7479|nr:cupredoxin family copper-binding protein [Sphingomonas bacterium]MDB5703974.1 amicyanin [Sphingomonas bacterium]